MCETGPDVPQPTRGPAASPEPHRCRAADDRRRSDGRSDWFPPAHERDRLRDRRARRAQPRGARRARPIPLAGDVEEGCRAHRLPHHDGIRAHQPAHRRRSRAARHRRAIARSIPGTDEVVNQLRGWDTDGLPARVAARDAARRRAAPELRRLEVASTRAPGFTAATMRGAEFHAADELAERVADRRRPRRAASGIVRVPLRARSGRDRPPARLAVGRVGGGAGEGGCRGPRARRRARPRHRRSS